MSSSESLPAFEFDRSDPEVVLFDLLEAADVRLRQAVARDVYLLDGNSPALTGDRYAGALDVFERYATTERDGRNGIKYGIIHITEDYGALLEGDKTVNWRIELPIDDRTRIATRLLAPHTAHLRVATSERRLIDTSEVSIDTIEELVLAKNALYAKLPEILLDLETYRLIPGK